MSSWQRQSVEAASLELGSLLESMSSWWPHWPITNNRLGSSSFKRPKSKTCSLEQIWYNSRLGKELAITTPIGLHLCSYEQPCCPDNWFWRTWAWFELGLGRHPSQLYCPGLLFVLEACIWARHPEVESSTTALSTWIVSHWNSSQISTELHRLPTCHSLSTGAVVIFPGHCHIWNRW